MPVKLAAAGRAPLPGPGDAEPGLYDRASSNRRPEFSLDISLLLKAALMGIVEGLTEFLPVSSTGHLILAGALLDFNDDRGKLFEIVIQSAAIMAVVWEFRARIGRVLGGLGTDPAARRLLTNVAIAFVPMALLGLLFGKLLKAHLFNAPTVATTFILGAFVILWAERRQHAVRVTASTI